MAKPLLKFSKPYIQVSDEEGEVKSRAHPLCNSLYRDQLKVLGTALPLYRVGSRAKGGVVPIHTMDVNRRFPRRVSESPARG